jgi:putative ABC transport system ATP-binding protein
MSQLFDIIALMDPIIKIRNLSVVYNKGKSNESAGLSDVSVDIYEGEYVSFFGPSGCGKSTLLNTIAGLESPTSGEVTVMGRNLSELNENERTEYHRNSIGMVFQAYYLIPNLSAFDNISLPQIFSKISVESRNDRTDELVSRFGLIEVKDRKPANMSGGQQQRTAIARALVNNAPIILADEPVGNLDTKNAEIVLDLLSDINIKEKKTVINVTHNPRDLHYAHRIFYIRDGKIERVVKNPNKIVNRSSAEGSVVPVSELEQLAQAHPYLSNTALEAKLVVSKILLPFDIETVHVIENAVSQFIAGKLTKDQLFHILDDSNGAGLRVERAVKLAKQIFSMVDGIKEIKRQTEVAKNKSLNEDLNRGAYIRSLVQKNVNTVYTPAQLSTIDLLINKRLSDEISSNTLLTELNKSNDDGGAGLHHDSVKKLSAEIEFYISQK